MLYINKDLLGCISSVDESAEGQAGSKKEEQNDKERKDEEDTPLPAYRAKSIVESWVWGRQPGKYNVFPDFLFME